MGYYDRLINEHVNKYENYYPITPCIQDENTPNKKHHSMCSYCYSCYTELCETISDYFGVIINNKHKLTHKCLYKICEKIRNISNNSIQSYDLLEPVVKKIVVILNKYTKYSKNEKEGYNLLHREFIESLMIPLDTIICRYYVEGEFNHKNWHKKTLINNALYNLNIFCLEMWCIHSYLETKITLESQLTLYNMVQNKKL